MFFTPGDCFLVCSCFWYLLAGLFFSNATSLGSPLAVPETLTSPMLIIVSDNAPSCGKFHFHLIRLQLNSSREDHNWTHQKKITSEIIKQLKATCELLRESFVAKTGGLLYQLFTFYQLCSCLDAFVRWLSDTSRGPSSFSNLPNLGSGSALIRS